MYMGINRYIRLGKTNVQRCAYDVFTCITVISYRDHDDIPQDIRLYTERIIDRRDNTPVPTKSLGGGIFSYLLR